MEAARLTRAAPVARRGDLTRHVLRIAPLGAILALATVLRLWSFDRVAANPFYDAAVRSMSLSWHNFLFGAFDPTAMSAIDKAPVDLWLQVASVQLLGFSSAALRLPELLAGIAAVALVYDLGRRLFGRGAGLVAAATLAVLPASVLTARSDTMDAVMMLLVVLTAWLIVRGAEDPRGGRGRAADGADRDMTGGADGGVTGGADGGVTGGADGGVTGGADGGVTGGADGGAARLGWMLAAGAALGLAFNVKLAEALLPLPALLLLAWLALPGSAAARLRALLAAGATFVAVALAWLVAVSLAPGPKPFPIGSTNGSAWNVVFVFDGIGRLGLSKSTAGRTGSGPLTLFGSHGDAFGALIGAALLAALLVGGLAVAVAVAERRGSAFAALRVRGRRRGLAALPPSHAGVALADGGSRSGARLAGAGAAFVAAWLLVGIVVFSRMSVVYARYLDAIAPAVALALGAGAAALAAASPRRRVATVALALAVAAVAALAQPVAHPRPAAVLVGGAVAVALALTALVPTRTRTRIPARAVLALAAAGLLVVPAAASVRIAGGHASDGGEPGAMPGRQLAHLSRFLNAHRGGARFQLATYGAAKAGPLIERDAQPVLILTTAYGRPLLTPHQLAAAVRAHRVRYVLTGGAPCVRGMPRERTGCAPVVLWAKAHGRDVSRDAGVRRGLLLRLQPRAVQ
jgi:4-amino-4-deoxy-L-arabinose transferase-like glycosyltransferase